MPSEPTARDAEPQAEAPAALGPLPGWEGLPSDDSPAPGSVLLSAVHAIPLVRKRYYRRSADGVLVGKVWFGPGCEGPPGHAHGGALAAVLDEAMGFALWRAGHRTLAASLQVAFRRPMPLGSVALLEASIERVEGRKITARSVLQRDGGAAIAEATGLYIRLTDQQLEAFRRARAEGSPYHRPE